MLPIDRAAEQVLDRLTSLRQHQQEGRRSPHKPLLVLLALGRLAATGSSSTPWSVAEIELAKLIAEFGPPSKTGPAQSAAYPFTRLRADGVWALDRDVPMDTVGPLRAGVTGRLEASLEEELRARPELVPSVARVLVDSHFPSAIAGDVLLAVGLDPEAPSDAGAVEQRTEEQRERSRVWRDAILEAWDQQCAFCGFDGRAGGVPVGIDAAHVRWFTLDGPDTLENGLALCVLHHKLFDRGMLGWTTISPSSCLSDTPHAHRTAGRSTTCTAIRWQRDRGHRSQSRRTSPGTGSRSSRGAARCMSRIQWLRNRAVTFGT